MVALSFHPQQGDPLGPFLFCNTIQPLLSSLSSELNLGCLDDVTLADPADTVASGHALPISRISATSDSDVAEIIEIGSAMGLALNTAKCELIAHRPGRCSARSGTAGFYESR